MGFFIPIFWFLLLDIVLSNYFNDNDSFELWGRMWDHLHFLSLKFDSDYDRNFPSFYCYLLYRFILIRFLKATSNIYRCLINWLQKKKSDYISIIYTFYENNSKDHNNSIQINKWPLFILLSMIIQVKIFLIKHLPI